MIEGGIVGDLNHATEQASVMIEGGIVGDLNRAAKQ
jgi:hypothetical protein